MSKALCRFCWERLGKPESTKKTVNARCYICNGLFSKVGFYASKIVSNVRRYEFRTFFVGVRLKQDILEREDELRSSLKLHGTPSIKSHFAKEIIKKVEKKIKAKPHHNPELLVIVDTSKQDIIECITKPVFFYGKYTKQKGVSQRKVGCRGECGGKGCNNCNGKGGTEPSVESIISEKLLKLSGGKRIRITWLGREEKESIVYPPGRPFIAEIKEPKKRNLTHKFKFKSKGVSFTGLFLPNRPEPPKLKVTFRIFLKGDYSIDDAKKVEDFFENREVYVLKDDNKHAKKKVYWVKFKQNMGNSFLEVEMDMGIPPRKFVEGGIVSPSISEILKAKIECLKFDIVRIEEVGGLRFA
jgi:tRNA pseudouridine synthase 10